MIYWSLVGLRAIEKEDLVILKNWRNNYEFRRNFREVRELSMSDQEVWFESLQKSKNQNFMFMIIDINNWAPIWAGWLLYVNWINRSADFSFYIGKDDLYIDTIWYAKESTKLLLDYAFNNLNLNKVWMELYEFDLLKINFFKNEFNFKIDWTLRQNCYEWWRYWDSYIISLLKQEFNELKSKL